MRDVRRPARDLDDVVQIAEMVRRFYADVAQDDLLGPMFNDVAHVDWSTHLPKLTAFWSRALLGLPGYVGNPFRAHSLVHQQRAFSSAHFERWLTLFHETLDMGWTGPVTARAHELADSIARVHSQQLVGTPQRLQREATTSTAPRPEAARRGPHEMRIDLGQQEVADVAHDHHPTDHGRSSPHPSAWHPPRRAVPRL